jgi:YbbR domain-containing protein
LAKIPGFVETAPIDVTGATADVTKKVALALPESVSVLDNPSITVQVSVTPILGGQTVPRRVVVQGLRPGLGISISPASVDVILSGPLPSLQNLQSDDVQVAIDVSTVGAGTYQLKPRVLVVPDALKVQNIVPDTVQVTITDTSAPTRSPATATPTAVPPTPTKASPAVTQ